MFVCDLFLFKKTHIYVVAVLAIEISQAGKVLPGN